MARYVETIWGGIDHEVTRNALYDSLQVLTIGYGAYFVNGRVKSEFMARLLSLAQLSRLNAYQVARLGDIHRLIYRSNISNTLSSLSLHRFHPNARTSNLFARCCSFCKVQDLTLDARVEDKATNSAYFIWKVLFTSTNTGRFYFQNIKGICIESFALERRNQRMQEISGLIIATSESRASLKHLITTVIKLQNSRNVHFSCGWSPTMPRKFEHREISYMKRIKKQQ